MIETVYSSENGEDNRTNRVQSLFKMPKNIRQIGKSNSARKIFVEDYVMTFIKQLGGDDYSKCKVAILLGKYVKQEDCSNIFISGAIEVENLDNSQGITFSNETWTEIYEQIKKYFSDAEIVGWFLGGPSYLLEEEDKILKTHIDNFAGQDKTLLTYDNVEREEAFHVFENSRLQKQEGYYIYYEKNDEMQTYMIEHNNAPSEESTFDDRVSREMREIIKNKKPSEDSRRGTGLIYAAGTLLAVIILIIGAVMLDNYEHMKNMEDTLSTLSKKLESEGSITAEDLNNELPSVKPDPNGTLADDDSSLDVNVVPGNIDPVEKEESKEEKSEEEESKEEVKPTTPPKEEPEEKTEKEEDKKPEEDSKTENQEEETSTKDNEDRETSKETKYYVVESGDTLVGISLKLYNSVDYVSEIMKLNNITDENYVYIGQKLIVP